MLWLVGICKRCQTVVATSSERGLSPIRNSKKQFCPSCYMGTLEYITPASTTSLDDEAALLRARALTDFKDIERVNPDED